MYKTKNKDCCLKNQIGNEQIIGLERTKAVKTIIWIIR